MASFEEYQRTLSTERPDHPLDQCRCGDYRRDHPENGPCVFNGRHYDPCHGMDDCNEFRLAVKHGKRGKRDD